MSTAGPVRFSSSTPGITGASLLPHPPVMLPEIGREQGSACAATVEAVRLAAGLAADSGPDALILISPHGRMFQDAVSISVSAVYQGDMSRFGCPGLDMKWPGDPELADAIIKGMQTCGIPFVRLEPGSGKGEKSFAVLDHGAFVPLYYHKEVLKDVRLVHITPGFCSPRTAYEAGRRIRQTAKSMGRRVWVIASGDLSHCLSPEAPCGFDPAGEAYDRGLLQKLAQKDTAGVLAMPPELLDNACQCGHLPLLMLLGSLHGSEYQVMESSYEAPFGVGYAVVVFKCSDNERENGMKSAEAAPDTRGDACTRLAKNALREYLQTGRTLKVPDDLPPEMRQRRAGAFVSMELHGELRGCIGTLYPTRPDLAEEIIANAIAAGTRDPRFLPVTPEELEEIDFHVDILRAPEPVESLSDLDPGKYGVIVRKGGKTGLLLPDLKGVDTVEQQVGIALRKAGIASLNGVTLERFRVERHPS
ncbi:MAG TPA: AMMECR1 domain-containing protein [Clostridiales bacterium]|nr:AMMECR1 domain-containing protein [Clostridiales bacterium]